MKTFYITFRSVTFAQRGEKALLQREIRCVLQRTPRWMEAQGCGYCLRVWTQDVGRVVRILQEEGILLRRMYFQRGDGLLEEMAL